ncbi:hypothetical protein RUND412_005247 [Rhizina undulata]
MSFPTIHISCPCSDSTAQRSKSDDEEGKTFDPRAARSTFSLFPLEHLLYCEDCNHIRCPRCVQEEIVCFYCPNCLFEVPSSTVKTEGNRCTRNCFSCPICFAALSVTSKADDQSGPYTLLCSHCLWSSSEIGIEFDKPTSITAQLTQKLRPQSIPQTPGSGLSAFASPFSPVPQEAIEYDSRVTVTNPAGETDLAYTGKNGKPPSDEEVFIRLKAHYTQQRAGSATDEFGTSPGALSRLMGLYSSFGTSSRSRSFGQLGKNAAKPKADWTEFDSVNEVGDDEDVIEKMMTSGFHDATSQVQRLAMGHHPRFVDDVRPVAALLRTKRSKRCRSCRHILVKPESKVSTTRFRIKLVAMNYIPALSISRLDPTAVTYANLVPYATHQFLLTITNPLFDPINVTLATPQRTPGEYPSTVTILCPEFEVGANTDVWDEALQSAQPTPINPSTASTATPAPTKSKKTKKPGTIGTIWDCGRNWTTVVIEIVPPHVPEDEDENEQLVMVPVLVRVVYETDLEREDGGLRGEQKERREYAYWCVLGVGRIGREVKEAEGGVVAELRSRGMTMGSVGMGVAGVSTAVGRSNRNSVR